MLFDLLSPRSLCTLVADIWASICFVVFALFVCVFSLLFSALLFWLCNYSHEVEVVVFAWVCWLVVLRLLATTSVMETICEAAAWLLHPTFGTPQHSRVADPEDGAHRLLSDLC